MEINVNKVQSFKGGLTPKILNDFRNINVKKVEEDFSSVGVDARFLNNKFISGSSVLVANILNEISGKYKLPFDFLPFSIRAYDDKNLVCDTLEKCRGFCITDTKCVLNGEGPFIGTSLFFNNSLLKFPILESINTTINALLNNMSSSHFLQTFFHEWFHCIQNNLIYEKYGYEGKCPVLRAKYYKPEANGLYITQEKDVITNFLLNPQIREQVCKFVSKYAGKTCLYSEFFAELMSKITINSLDSKLNPIKNPLDNIPKGLPLPLKEYVEKILNI